MKYKIIRITRKFIIFFLLGYFSIHGLLSPFILIFHKWYNNLLYHYSEYWLWNFLFFILPALFGILSYFWLRNKVLSQKSKIIFASLSSFIVLINITGLYLNNYYWGYITKRPCVFNEVQHATKILNSCFVSNVDSTGFHSWKISKSSNVKFNSLYGRKDLYYGVSDRSLMVFQDNASVGNNLSDFEIIFNDSLRNIDRNILKNLESQIRSSGIVDLGEPGYDSSGQLSGFITEFITKDDEKYVFTGLSGTNVANDHYSKYEILFNAENGEYKLLKKQRFYVDIAGLESIEFAIISPFFSLLLTIVLMGIILMSKFFTVLKQGLVSS